MSKKPVEDYFAFYEAFVGEYILATTKIIIEATVVDEETGPISVTEAITVRGYLCDMDEEYLYIGPQLTETREAVLRSEVVHVKIVEPHDPALELLSSLPAPTKDEDIN
jgi:hypothetical protein